MSNLTNTGGSNCDLYRFFLGKYVIQKSDSIPEVGHEMNNDDDDDKKNADEP